MRLQGTRSPFSWKYKLNYLPFQILDSDHISSCTSAGSVLQLCKVSQKSNKPFRRRCAYKVHDPPFRESISWIISPSKFWTATIFLHAHLQVVYYKCVKFHKNKISRLGGIALTRYMPSFFSWKYKLNYLPFQILDSDHISSCTSAGSVLQMCKVSYKSNKSLRRSCAYKVHGRMDGWTRWFLYTPPNFVCRGYNYLYNCIDQ